MFICLTPYEYQFPMVHVYLITMILVCTSCTCVIRNSLIKNFTVSLYENTKCEDH